MNTRGLTYYLAIVGIGLTAVLSQTILLRELVSAFYGNELIYGVVLALWLLLTGVSSSFLGTFTEKIKNKTLAFAILELVISLVLIFEIYYSRVGKFLFGIPQGGVSPLSSIILIGVFVLAPLTILLGFQFSLGVKMLGEAFGTSFVQIGQTYMLETLGFFAGGLIFTFILIYFFNSFGIVSLIGIFLSASSISLIKLENSSPACPLPQGRRVRNLIKFLGILILLFSTLNLLFLNKIIDKISHESYFRGFELLEVTDSPYGRIAAIKAFNEINFFEGGSLIFSTADTPVNEEIVHLTLLQNKNPKSILLLGGGLGGVLKEVLKYKIDEIDYVELDPIVIKLAEKYVSQPVDSRLKIYATDGRLFINTTKKKYDVILINLPDPTTALLNRFYTYEFFTKCKGLLKRGGVFSIHLSTSESYMGTELRELNASIYKTLNEVFPATEIIASNYNYFYASNLKNVLSVDRVELLSRWQDRRIKTSYFQSFVMRFILSPSRLSYVADSIKYSEATEDNKDFKPVSYYYNMLLWVSYFGSPLKQTLYALKKINLAFFLILILATFLILKAFSLINERVKRSTIPLMIFLLSFAGMTMQIIIIFSFQALYGYVYHIIGLLLASFMLGLTSGSFISNIFYKRIKLPKLVIAFTIFGLTLYLLGLQYLLFYISKHQYYFYIFPLIRIIFPFAAALTALPIGFIFPLAAKLYERQNIATGRLAGILYGMDLFGGSLSAILASIFLIPVYGILSTCSFAIVLSFLGFILLI